MKLSAKHFFAALSMLTVLAAAPTTASAGDSVYISVPGLSVGFHDVHHRSNRRYRNKNTYYDNNRNYKGKYRQSRKRYSRNRNYNNRNYSSRNYNNRSYSNRSYNDGNYYNYSKRTYNNSYRGDYCPTDGYSQYYDRNRNCYEHNGHYHCS